MLARRTAVPFRDDELRVVYVDHIFLQEVESQIFRIFCFFALAGFDRLRRTIDDLADDRFVLRSVMSLGSC